MKKIRKVKDSWGDTFINVYECDKFSYEYQPDMPWLNERYLQDYIKRQNVKKYKNCIIIIYRRIVFYVKEQWERDTRILWRESIYILIPPLFTRGRKTSPI